MKIYLINSPLPFQSNRPVFPPLGLLTLSSVMKNAGYNDIHFFDFLGRIEPINIYADIFFFYVSTPSYSYIYNIVKYLKNMNPNAKFIVGGPHATFMPQELTFFDSIVIGEGEISVLQILNDYPNVKSIYHNQPMNINDIPLPDRDIININEYANNLIVNNLPTTTVISSRGCSYGKCAFCAQYLKKPRFRSAKNIYKEVLLIKEKHNINSIMFFDDEFLSHKKRLEDICKYIKNLNIQWKCLCRVESITQKTISMIKDAGCVGLHIGIESGDQGILNNVAKNINIENAEKVIKIIKDNGLYVKEFIIIGLPGESKKSISNTDDFIRKTQPDDIDVSIFCAFPGSDIWNNPEKYDIKFNKKCYGWYKGFKSSYYNTCPISTSNLTFDEILTARNEIENKYKSQEKLIK